ncbi:MAG: hypothetical protein JW892_09090 [Anaerolineae bacterium]|nr:hypothetical protein [Anaerolineae bacterium]
MTRGQTLILMILAVLVIAVIAAMGYIVWRSSRLEQAVVTPLTLEIAEVRTVIPTWTPTPAGTATPTLPPALTRTPLPTRTPFPTATPTNTPTPIPVELVNGEFDGIMPNRIPGWEWSADINYIPGGEYDPHNSYAEPIFSAADDPARRINGSTLKIETIRWLKFRAWVYQTVTATTGSTVYLQVRANAFSSIDQIKFRAGIDAQGNAGCSNARWSEVTINQDDGIVTITSPRVVVGAAGRITACLYAEPLYPDTNNAAFFDRAVLVVAPPRP